MPADAAIAGNLDVDVAIVGGGTAGWLTAVALARCLRPDLTIALVESPDVPVIGVGESTLPTLGATLRGLGIDEADWMPQVGATYKLGVRFRDWCASGSTVSRADFWNPVEQICDPAAVQTWFGHARSHDFPAACCTTTPLLERGLIPRTPDGERLGEYAYHVDAVKLGALLRDTAVADGVRHRPGHVQRVALSDARTIGHLELEAGGIVRAQLFVDCTGFRSILLGDALGEPWLSYDKHLLTDRAIAISTGRPVDGPLPNHTTARALSAGWMWSVPLAERTGSGYVFSSGYQSADDAERELRSVLGPQADGQPARHIEARTGRRRRSWVGNCVAIGLASGFVEPLEATGIYFVERAIVGLLRALDSGDRQSYNDLMTTSYEEVRDLIVMHYLVNDRQDTEFWKATKHDVSVPDSLAARLAEWQSRAPVAADFPEPAVFSVTTWLSVLAGMGYWRDRFSPMPHEPPASAMIELERRRLLRHATPHDLLVDVAAPSHAERAC